jgi:hypothetical protein
MSKAQATQPLLFLIPVTKVIIPKDGAAAAANPAGHQAARRLQLLLPPLPPLLPLAISAG